jgi:hypothetical protein
MDRGFSDAIAAAEDFQRKAADHGAAGRMDARALSLIAATLRQAGIAASGQLAASILNQVEKASFH